MEPTTIFHIAQTKDWQKATLIGVYFPASYEHEKFIHCSTIKQVAGVLDRYFKNQTVLKLTINVALLVHPPKYELAPSVNQLFPHIYGPINLDAVTAVEQITG